MKKIVCEICGNTEFTKINGLFTCQGCGTSFGPEDIKSMIQEVEDDTTSVVIRSASSNTDQIDRYLNLATEELYAGNIDSSKKYINRVLELDDKNHFAWFLNAQIATLAIKDLASISDNIKTVERNLDKTLANLPIFDLEILNALCKNINQLHKTAYLACGRAILDAYYNLADFEECIQTARVLAINQNNAGKEYYRKMLIRLANETPDIDKDAAINAVSCLSDGLTTPFPIDTYKSVLESLKVRASLLMNKYIQSVKNGENSTNLEHIATDISNQLFRLPLLGAFNLDKAMSVCEIEYGIQKLYEYNQSLDISMLELMSKSIDTLKSSISSIRSDIGTEIAKDYEIEHATEIRKSKAEREQLLNDINDLNNQIRTVNYKNDPRYTDAIHERYVALQKVTEKQKEIDDKQCELNRLGLFSGKEKKHLTVQIKTLYNELIQLKKASEETYNKLNEVETQLSLDIKLANDKVYGQIKALRKKADSIEAKGYNLNSLIDERIAEARIEFDKYSSNAGNYDIYKDLERLTLPVRSQTIYIPSTTQLTPQPSTQSKKKNSVIKDAIAGGILAGPAGAVVGALHAVDKNLNN